MTDLHEYPDDFEPPLGAEGTASSAQTTDETNAPPVVDPDTAGELAPAESWPTADIEQAYLKALEAMGDIPWEEGGAESSVEATAGGPASNVEPLPDATPAAPTGPNGEVNGPPPE